MAKDIIKKIMVLEIIRTDTRPMGDDMRSALLRNEMFCLACANFQWSNFDGTWICSKEHSPKHISDSGLNSRWMVPGICPDLER